jgi:hypothetical protein
MIFFLKFYDFLRSMFLSFLNCVEERVGEVCFLCQSWMLHRIVKGIRIADSPVPSFKAFSLNPTLLVLSNL